MQTSIIHDYIKFNNNNIKADLGQLQNLTQIGQGGNGLVYSAELNNKKVAIKFLSTGQTGQTKINKEKRFLAEYLNVITLPLSPHIVRYIDYELLHFHHDDNHHHIPAIIMKLYEGSLKDWGKESPTKEKFERLANFLLDSVEFIHENGIIHRDLKPENLLLQGENLFLTDFGIAAYNPSLFIPQSLTKKGERLANRLFSAPEQETPDVLPSETMDIYAIGQILQWYATGKVHRGTGRKKISSIFPDLEIYDKIIDKCLMQNATQRPTNIQAIRKELKKEPFVDIYDDFRKFNKVFRKTFPKHRQGVFSTEDPTLINRLLSNLSMEMEHFDAPLQVNLQQGDCEFSTCTLSGTRWRFDTIEYDIVKIWIHTHSSLYNDFILIQYNADQPFMINGKSQWYDIIVDGLHHISDTESSNGYAEIDNEILSLQGRTVVHYDREEEAGYFFISTKNHCAYYSQNDRTVKDFIKKVNVRGVAPSNEEVHRFSHEISFRKPMEVTLRM